MTTDVPSVLFVVVIVMVFIDVRPRLWLARFLPALSPRLLATLSSRLLLLLLLLLHLLELFANKVFLARRIEVDLLRRIDDMHAATGRKFLLRHSPLGRQHETS